MSELTIDIIQDLNRVFDYVFIINDGTIKKMITKEEENHMNYIEMPV